MHDARHVPIVAIAALLGACAAQPEQPDAAGPEARAEQPAERTPPAHDDPGGGPADKSVTEKVLLEDAPSQDPPGEDDDRAARPAPRRPDRPAWWLDEPNAGQAGFAATVKAEAPTVTEARAAAVDAAHAAVEAQYGRLRDDARIEKTLILSPEPGLYRAFVYVSCPGPTSAKAGDEP